MGGREEQLARNEALFREVNERLRDLGTGVPGDEAIEFVCECGRAECVERIRLSAAQYEEVRSDATQFAVAPGHEAADVEVVVRAGDGFVVVRKRDDEARIAIETDPRRRG